MIKGAERKTRDFSSDKPFLDHLEDLRRALIRCVLVLGVAVLVALPLAPLFLGILLAPLRQAVPDADSMLRSLEVAGAFTVTLRIAFWSGLLVSSPALVFIIGQFVFPGLTAQERRVVARSGIWAVALFALGAGLAYWVTLPVAIQVMFGLHAWLGVAAEWTVTSYVTFATQLLIGFGLAFEMPVVVVILGRLGIVSSAQLRQARPLVVIILLVVAMVLTPPDIFTQLMMAVPLIVLYEGCIAVVRATERRAGR